jgi:hypothetical protein
VFGEICVCFSFFHAPLGAWGEEGLAGIFRFEMRLIRWGGWATCGEGGGEVDVDRVPFLFRLFWGFWGDVGCVQCTFVGGWGTGLWEERG